MGKAHPPFKIEVPPNTIQYYTWLFDPFFKLRDSITLFSVDCKEAQIIEIMENTQMKILIICHGLTFDALSFRAANSIRYLSKKYMHNITVVAFKRP